MDFPDYTDKWGRTCKQMMMFEVCKDGILSNESVLFSKDYVINATNGLGQSAMDACCECGGGIPGNYAKK